MATASAIPSTDSGLLLLADISGYTEFLRLVEAAHPEMTGSGGIVPPAYPVLSSLLDTVVERITPTFTLERIEGDAVFAYTPGDRLAGAAAILLEVVRSAYRAFKDRSDEAMVLHRHDCQACMILPSLELKFVVHHGTFVVQRIAGGQTVAGPAVNLAHRLLKNSVTEHTGRRGYLLVTDAAAARLDLTPETGVAHEEHYADAVSVRGTVIGLDVAGTSEGGRPTTTIG